MSDEDIDYVMKTFSGRDFEYYKVERAGDSYKLSLKKMEDKYPTAEKYCPNSVGYDIEMLLDVDKCAEGVGYNYRTFVEEALLEVSHEPFVTAISHIVVSDDKQYPHIMVWAKIKQDGSAKRMRSFEYDVIDGKLIRV